MNFKDKVVLVTGPSRGIGASTVLAFAKRGANVVINYVQEKEKAEALAHLIEAKQGVKTLIIKADISKEEEVKSLVQTTLETFGKIDVLVNNAGIAIDTLLEDKTKENFMRTLEVNLVGTFLMCKEVGSEMLKKQKGVIINVSSTNGIDTVYPESIDYDASKAGVISLTKNFSKAYAPFIRVNTVCPGWVNTDMNQTLEQDFIDQETSKILVNRFAEPEEIANAIVFLASDEASYINGTILRVDGGCK